MKTSLDEKYYAPREVAERLGVHYRTILRLVERGELGAVKVGTDWRIGERDLEKFIQANRAGR